jgi:tetratricopeptide (TPR) repeat protein
VVRLAPESVAGHRRLKALYLERPQVEEACGEILAIAQILHMRGQREAAQRELQEGLRLAPGHAALERLLTEVSGGAAAPASAAMPRETAPTIGASEVGGEADLGGGMTPLPGEDLLPELQDLLEEPGESPRPVAEAGDADVDQAMKDDLAEAEFYLSQGMAEEARAVHKRMRTRNASHPSVARLGKQLGASAPVEAPEPAKPQPSGVTSFADLLDETAPGPPSLAQESPPESVTPKFSVMDGEGEAGADGFVNLGAELEEELAAEETGGSAPGGAPGLGDILREFQKGVHEHLDEKDFETHYNLGIAYKEMDLHDEAIEEFRLAARDPGRALACTELLGLCYLAKADPEAAIREFRAGLEIRGHPREAYHSLRYNLGSAHETRGDLRGALEAFEVLQAEDAHFRDVSTRVQELRERLPAAPAPVATAPMAPASAAPDPVAAAPVAPGQTGEHAKRGREKKISFI